MFVNFKNNAASQKINKNQLIFHSVMNLRKLKSRHFLKTIPL